MTPGPIAKIIIYTLLLTHVGSFVTICASMSLRDAPHHHKWDEPLELTTLIASLTFWASVFVQFVGGLVAYAIRGDTPLG